MSAPTLDDLRRAYQLSVAIVHDVSEMHSACDRVAKRKSRGHLDGAYLKSSALLFGRAADRLDHNAEAFSELIENLENHYATVSGGAVRIGGIVGPSAHTAVRMLADRWLYHDEVLARRELMFPNAPHGFWFTHLSRLYAGDDLSNKDDVLAALYQEVSLVIEKPGLDTEEPPPIHREIPRDDARLSAAAISRVVVHLKANTVRKKLSDYRKKNPGCCRDADGRTQYEYQWGEVKHLFSTS
ncbi:hypothetical protein Pan216_37200 [Planctomycetes bacterium Pan216]|uniref:Uncharacterized protein n=1 Tax=Kolteria novifilia TaxID=2527975 RepID=A0A518B794_9BACT|nr:hypothetical protein Pan216_37200 [Planctomycetes bacterium Pan216]